MGPLHRTGLLSFSFMGRKMETRTSLNSVKPTEYSSFLSPRLFEMCKDFFVIDKTPCSYCWTAGHVLVIVGLGLAALTEDLTKSHLYRL